MPNTIFLSRIYLTHSQDLTQINEYGLNTFIQELGGICQGLVILVGLVLYPV